jgi:hypothetical protein
LSPNELSHIDFTEEEVVRIKEWTDKLPEKIFNRNFLEANQIDELEGNYDMNLFLSSHDSSHETATLLKKAIQLNDMENIGYATNFMRDKYRNLLWKALVAISVECGNGILTKEIVGLKLTDDIVNKSKKPESRDEIFLSKSIMLLCYEQRRMFDSLSACTIIDPYSLIDWSKYEIHDISTCFLPDGIVPEYVYDVHTIKGKKLGKTDWGMNLVEQEALSPLQISFFDDGSWAPRYDYKHEHGMCTEGEYLESLEYRKTRKGNPMFRIPEGDLLEHIPYDEMDACSKRLHKIMNE